MREGWRETTLGDVFQIERERRDPRQLPPSTPYVGLEHLVPMSPTPSWGAIAASVSSSVTPFRADDILFGRLRPYLRKVAIASKPGVCSPELLVLRGAPNKILPGYLYALVSSAAVLERCVAVSAGSRMPRTSASDLAAVPVLLPPLGEQRRIVDLIGAVDEAIQAAEQARGRAGSARANLIRDWFASADALPKSLGEVTSVLQGSPLVKTLQGQQSGPVPWYKIADMTRPGNEFGYTRAETMVASEVIARNNGNILPRGTIVFPRVGAAVLTEKKRILDTAGACDENHLAIAPSDSLVPGYTLAFFENFPLASLVQSGAVPSLNQGLVRQIPIPIPPVPEQVELAEVTMAMRESERELTCCKLALAILRSALLSELLSGDHEIPASYDAVMG